eukprot:6019406-Pyramimonas_sp.AAC.1
MVCLIAPVTNDSDVQESQKLGSVCLKRGRGGDQAHGYKRSHQRLTRLCYPYTGNRTLHTALDWTGLD